MSGAGSPERPIEPPSPPGDDRGSPPPCVCFKISGGRRGFCSLLLFPPCGFRSLTPRLWSCFHVGLPECDHFEPFPVLFRYLLSELGVFARYVMAAYGMGPSKGSSAESFECA